AVKDVELKDSHGDGSLSPTVSVQAIFVSLETICVISKSGLVLHSLSCCFGVRSGAIDTNQLLIVLAIRHLMNGPEQKDALIHRVPPFRSSRQPVFSHRSTVPREPKYRPKSKSQ